MPRVSVIMPVYNREKYLGAAIESILAQTLADFELLVVDDGSTDASAEIMQEYAERDRRVRFFRHEVNQGQGAAINTGLETARGALVAIMDSDDISKRERLQMQADFLRAHPEIGAVGCWREVYNQDLTHLHYVATPPRRHALLALNWFIGGISLGATIMIRAEFLRAVGGYSAEAVSQDLDLEARLLHTTSIKLACLEDYLYVYRRHPAVQKKGPGTEHYANYFAMRRRVLEWLWGEAPAASVQRFEQLALGGKLSWNERRKTKRDLIRLAKSLVAAEWVEPGDEALLMAAINRRLEDASPRLWQKFCYWRRYRLPWLFPDRTLAGSAGKD